MILLISRPSCVAMAVHVCDATATAVGYFTESIDSEYGIVHHKIYIHQKYIRLFIVDTYARLKPGNNGSLVLNLKYPTVNSSTDMIFTNPTYYQGGSL